MNDAVAELTDSETNFNRSVRLGIAAGGITQGGIADALGITGSQVSQRMKGRIKWTLRDMHTIATIFGVSPVELINGSTEWLDRIEETRVRERLDEARESARVRRATSGNRPTPPKVTSGAYDIALTGT